MNRAVSLLILACCWGIVPHAWAHEVRPAYLEIRQASTDTYDVLWKVPAANESLRLGIYVRFPEGTEELTAPHGMYAEGAYVERSRVQLAGGLAGRTIHIDGLAATKIDVLARVDHGNGVVQTTRILPDTPEFIVEVTPAAWRVSATYLGLGVDHILKGVDHLLFVLGLLLIVRTRWMLFRTITAFTVAHSITLAVATLGYASAPLPPLNAAIALSILFLGPEIVRVRRGETSLTIRYPWVVAFAFGLLHGFGFASGLKATGLPQTDIAWALLLFNVGVEIGQLFFVFLILGMAWSYRQLEIRWPRWAMAMPGYAVGTLGAYWTIQRTAMLLGFIR
jgi:hydrogenase/urease accessory protein HupE